MNTREYTLRVKKSWVKYGFVAIVAAMVLAPVAVSASHTFTDVPDTHIFHSDIAWMADNGITSGCTPTEYCPGDSVTRGQMAKFLRNVAENKVVDAATAETADHATTADSATDAATVDGYAPTDLTLATGNSTTFSIATLTSHTNTTIEEITATAPIDGYFMVNANASWLDSDDSRILHWLQVDDTACTNTTVPVASVDFGYGSTTALAQNDNVAIGGVIAVTAGSHTVTLCAREFSSSGDPQYYSPTVQVLFTPFGSVTEGLAEAGVSSELELPGTDN